MQRFNIDSSIAFGGGIYALYNLDNHRIYIGQTRNFRARAFSHKNMLSSGTHSNKAIQEDFAQGHCFYFVVLEACGRCDDLNLILKEKQYIFAFKDSSIKLYNLETKEQLAERLFYDIVMPDIRSIQKRLRKKVGCPLISLEKRKKQTLLYHFERMRNNHRIV